MGATVPAPDWVKWSTPGSSDTDSPINYFHGSQDHSFPTVTCVPACSLLAIKRKSKWKGARVWGDWVLMLSQVTSTLKGMQECTLEASRQGTHCCLRKTTETCSRQKSETKGVVWTQYYWVLWVFFLSLIYIVCTLIPETSLLTFPV